MNYFHSLLKVVNHPLNKNKKLKTLSRIFWWKINQKFFKLPVVVEFTSETNFICYPDSSYGSYVVYTRFPEYTELQFIYQYLQNNDVFFDVGAHSGSETLVAASKIYQGKIFSFEPSLDMLNLLRENLALNSSVKSVTAVNKVVSDQNGTETFTTANSDEERHIVYSDQENGNNKTVKLRAITLDTFVAQKNIKFIDFLKVDVEGAELKVLKGLKKFLNKRKVGVILFEVNPLMRNFGFTPRELLLFLEKFKYQLYIFTSNVKLKKTSSRKFKLDKTTNLLAVLKTKKITKRLKPFIE